MYEPPLSDIAWSLGAAGLDAARQAGLFPGLGDLVDPVLAEAGRFAAGQLAPLQKIGDETGARLDGTEVTTPPGWRAAYAAWCAGGWNGMAAPEAWGGQGLPLTLSAGVQEMWHGACTAFALAPMLTSGAIEALSRHGGPELQAAYLPRLVSGEWAATMNLTEPQAGSDVGALTTRAEPQPDGSFRLFGQKIFITYGEHDLTDNIVHMVLARLPDAPAGSRGISLFLVPKLLPGADGAPAVRNDLFCAGLERKLGLHASPTCSMLYGDGRFGDVPGATGWLVGEPNRGLAAMFTMMNNARLMVGVQGVGIAERALQLAEAYAAERRQGRAPGWQGQGMSPIDRHPDVARMLLTMRALTAASRALCHACAFAADMASLQESGAVLGDPFGAEGDDPHGDGALGRDEWAARAAILTPLAKAFATDSAVDVSSLAVQVLGGAGYIEEAGASQLLRDARITAIYEGTNGIQALDLVTRRLRADSGRAMRRLVDRLRPGEATANLRASMDFLLQAPEPEALAGATPFLRLLALCVADDLLRRHRGEARRRVTAHVFATSILPQAAALRTAITDGGEAVLAGIPA